MTSLRVERIRELLTQVLTPTHLEISDDGHQHIGHIGSAAGGHFSVAIAAPAFQDKSLVACHQLVYSALGDFMKTDIHALSIQILR